MWLQWMRYAVLMSVICALQSSFARTTVIDFDALPDSTPIRDFYQSAGVSFVRATAVTTGVSLNEFEFPPRSGKNAAFDNSGTVILNFAFPVARVGGYFTYATPIRIQAFNGSGILVSTATCSFSNNEALSGDPASSPNEFLQVSSSGGITQVIISGAPFGSSFTMDDLTISDTLDVTPPTTVASPSVQPNSNGWNNTNITILLNAVDDPGGSGVKEVHWSLAGAQSGAAVVPGNTASLIIENEGATTLTYFAIDQAGNIESNKTLNVKLDKTPPTISGLPQSPCTIWPPNKKFVQVADVTVFDGLSGLAAGSFKVGASSSEPQAPNAPDILINSVATGFSVQLRADRLGTGPGRTYVLTATATDLADNMTTLKAICVVPHDQGN
jgi:hypothetical protein